MTKILGYSNKIIIVPKDMTKTDGGIIVSPKNNKPYKTSKVISVGDEVVGISEGDTVVIPAQSDMEIEINGTKVSVIQKEAILAIVKENLDA